MQRQPSLTRKPTLAIVSHTLRRDLEEPLRHFSRLRIIHLYHDASYQDMSEADFGSKPIRYQSSRDVERLLGELKPDIIQGPEPYASRLSLANCWAVYHYATRTSTPYFFPMFENVPAEVKFGPLVGVLMRWILGRYAAKARGVVTLNDGARQGLLAAGVSPKKLTRLVWGTWGINTAEFGIDPKRRSERPTVLFVGRISVKKGLDTLLDAWESILEAVPTAQLIVGGPALDEDGQTLLARLRTTPAADYVGPIKNAELPRSFQEAWVTVAPSVTTPKWVEQVGMVALQSMSCGTPVVTTRSGAIPEYVGPTAGGDHGAILVDEHDATAIARETIAILQNPKLRDRLGKKGREHILKNYEVKKSVRQCEEYVLDLFEKAKSK